MLCFACTHARVLKYWDLWTVFGPTLWLAKKNKDIAIWPTSNLSNTRQFHLFWFICIIPCAFPYMGQPIFMKCTVQVSKWNFLYVPCPVLLIRPHLSLDSFQKAGLLARPAGGAVEKKWAVGQSCYSGISFCRNFLKLGHVFTELHQSNRLCACVLFYGVYFELYGAQFRERNLQIYLSI